MEKKNKKEGKKVEARRLAVDNDFILLIWSIPRYGTTEMKDLDINTEYNTTIPRLPSRIHSPPAHAHPAST